MDERNKIIIVARTYIILGIKYILKLLRLSSRKQDSVYEFLFTIAKRVAYISRYNKISLWFRRDPDLQKLIQCNDWTENVKQLFYIKNAYSNAVEQATSVSPRILVLAAGLGVRWQDEHLKQLVVVNGKPLIEHIIDRLPQSLVVTHHDKLKKYQYIEPSRHEYVLDTLLSTHSLWHKRTIILLGDTLYGRADLDKIISYSGEFVVFGSSKQVEIFALSFSDRHIESVIKHIYIALKDAYGGGRGKIWDMYHSHEGMPLYKIGVGRNFIELTDTTDIDTKEEYQNLLDKKEFKSPLA